jgi:hypothetical protein
VESKNVDGIKFENKRVVIRGWKEWERKRKKANGCKIIARLRNMFWCSLVVESEYNNSLYF